MSMDADQVQTHSPGGAKAALPKPISSDIQQARDVFLTLYSDVDTSEAEDAAPKEITQEMLESLRRQVSNVGGCIHEQRK